MIQSSDVKIFVTASHPDQQKPLGVGRFFGELVAVGSPTRLFSESIVLTADTLSLVWAVTLIFSLQHSPVTTLLLVEALFLVSVLLLFLARKSVHVPTIFAYYAVVLLLSIPLNLFFNGTWGDMGLYLLCGYTIYRFPLSWAWPIVLTVIVTLAATHNLNSIFQAHSASSILGLLSPLLIVALIGWITWTRRSRHLLIIELQEVQAQLRAQIARTEELATTRERARIARDIHDVLAHTLTVLSIQVQAARQLAQSNPDKLAAKLDDMASLVRESIAESRRVVGLLRESAIAPATLGDMGKQLQAIVERFGERTGIRCTFTEDGTPVPLQDRQGETLQFALQEALTNAHRHGAAHTVKAELHWQPEIVTLDVHDDGLGEGKSQYTEGTHQGLQGMRERARALGGTLEAGSSKGSSTGFTVTLSLPLHETERFPVEVHHE